MRVLFFLLRDWIRPQILRRGREKAGQDHRDGCMDHSFPQALEQEGMSPVRVPLWRL